MNIITWTLPTGVAADKTARRITRFRAYRDNHTTRLLNGVRPKPTLATVAMILDAFDGFGAALAVEDGSFTTPTNP
tara:strand:- start:368 stop:595 length:228 start_codon:yes stop_codon:yes gene_type:complete